MSLKRAGEIPGSESSEAVTRWYSERTLSASGIETGGSDEIGEIIHLEDLTQEEFDRLDRFLKITPAEKGSGLSDVSINHDKYLAENSS